MDSAVFDFVFEIEDQRDWQRRPGCAKNAFSCFFCHLLKLVASRVAGPGGVEVHDTTYGIGSFYEHCNGIQIYAADIKRWPWAVAPAQFRQADALTYLRELPEGGRRRRVVVVDPPFPTYPASNARSYEWLYYPKPWQFTYLMSVIKEARAKAGAVLLKYMPTREEEARLIVAADYVVTWRFVKSHVPVGENLVVRNASKVFIFLSF